MLMDALAQLQRLVRLKVDHWLVLNQRGQALLSHVTFARFVDCCEAGMGPDAGALVLQHRFKVAGR